jgi:hypothetical protein
LAIEKAGLLVVVGQLSADELKAIKEVYRGEPQLLTVGQFREKPGSAPLDVSILPPPGNKSVVLEDFLKFLRTPEAARAVAPFGLTVAQSGEGAGLSPPAPTSQPGGIPVVTSVPRWRQ